MGYFTWKDCQNRRKSVGYGHRVYVVCPDDTLIIENCYDGYGMFGKHDIHDLVVDWNRPHLKEIFERMLKKDKDCWGSELYPVAIAAMESDETALETVKELKKKGELQSYMFLGEDCEDWKRVLGIAITAIKNNEKLPYPIKMSSTRPLKPYSQLKASIDCQ